MYPKKLAYYFDLAAKVAIGGDKCRNFLVGSVAIRRDGVLICARNGAVFCTDTENYQSIASAHSEFRASNKLDKGSVIYVARIARFGGGLTPDGNPLFALSRPCFTCKTRLIARGVHKAYYTIDPLSYGVMNFRTGEERQVIITKDSLKELE